MACSSIMADFAPCDRLLQKAYYRHTAYDRFYLCQRSVMPLINSHAKVVKHISRSPVLIKRKLNDD